MKNIKMKILFLVMSIFAVTAFLSCEKAEKYFLNDEITKDEINIANTKEAPDGGIMIRRKYKWKLTFNPNNCEVGKGLCISGDYPPDPVPVEDVFYGLLIKHPESENQLIFYFCDQFFESEEELIIDGKLIIDEDVSIDEAMTIMIGIEYPAKIKQGEYSFIDKKEAGWNIVIVDIE